MPVYQMVRYPATFIPKYLKSPPISTFCVAFHIFTTSGDRDFELGRYT